MRHGRCVEHYENTAADLKYGQKASISSLGRGRGFKAKMLGLGVRPGMEMEIVYGHSHGPCIIKVGRQKVMIGHEMLSGIILKGEKK
jgi:Fe2+ transport system protein FeoA